jgi:hypothetical protein
MALIVEKKQGIRLPLASAVPTPLHQSREVGGYYKVRSYHGGGEFFQPENAQVILQSLGEFLPRAVERAGSDGRLEIFYQHLSNGQDVCSSTAPLDSGVNVPRSEITRLEAAIAQLKAKENDPGTDPTKREIIRAFRLPSPQKDPELYRLHGSGSNRRLLVLWGVEKEAGSSLSPQEALDRVPQSRTSMPWWVWLLLGLLLLALLGWWWSLQHPESAIGRLLPGTSTPTHIVVLEPELGSADSSKGTSLGNDLTSSPAVSLASASTLPAESEPRAAMPGSSGDSKKGESTASIPAGSTAGRPDGSKMGDSPSPMPTGSTPQSPSTLTSRRSTTLPDDPNKPEDPQQQAKSAEARKPGDSKEAERAKPGELTASMPAAATPPGESNKSEPSKLGEPPPSSKSPEAVPPLASTPPKVPADTPAPRPAMAADSPKVTEPPPSSTPTSSPKPREQPGMSLSAEIVNARTSAAPKDGKVEMQLSMLARDSDGKAITISKVEGWTVDGKQQNDNTGRPITTNGLPVNLTEGAHRVRVTGTAADGRQVSAEAEVNVGIAVREESTVKVKQVGKP